VVAPNARLIFPASGTALLTIAHQDTSTPFAAVPMVNTNLAGRTMWLAATAHRVYVLAATTTPAASGRPQVVSGTRRVLVLGPGA
jgi:hypothetical protein